MARCKARTKSGAPCNGYAIEGSKFCFTHDPKRAAERAAAHSRGGKNHPTLANDAPFPQADVKTAAGLLAFMESVIKCTWQLEDSIARARTLGYLAQVQKGVLEIGELEQRVEALEATLKARPNQ